MSFFWQRYRSGAYKKPVSRVLVTSTGRGKGAAYALIAVDAISIGVVLWIYYETLAPLFETRDALRWLMLTCVTGTSALLIVAIVMSVRYLRQRQQEAYAGNAFWQLRQAMQPFLTTTSLLFVTSAWATYHLPWDAPASIALYCAMALAKIVTYYIANEHRRMLVRHILAMEKYILDPASNNPPLRAEPIPPPPPEDDNYNEFATLQMPETFRTATSSHATPKRMPKIKLPKGKAKKNHPKRLDSPREGISMTSLDDAEHSEQMIDGARGHW